ncbi:MAG: T9SS type A sorting domain-containing protein [Chitinophagaceae bacterium]|nr:T9SS type A sorting domain-containing protein [Chitinophagaceae bacterium]
MKQNSTLACTVLCIVLTVSLNFNAAKAQCVAPSLVYQNATLVSGTAGNVNAKYKFPSVAAGVDAYVTILNKVGGATLSDIDDVVAGGYNAAWQPTVKTKTAPGAGESYISFKIEFKNSSNGSNHVFNCFQLSFIDVDGDNDKVREFVAAKGCTNYTIANNSVLTMSTQSGMTKALGPITTYADIDTSSYPTNINFRYMNTDKVEEIWIGSKVSNGFTVQDRYNCSYFANVTIPNGSTLPVSYLSFDAVVNDKSVLLKWMTAQEINNNYFEVERSFDMNEYNTIGMVLDGFTVNGTGKSYQFKDNSAELQGKTMAYYRLKQIDMDGKATYSKVLAVRLQAKAGVAMQVSPNPFVENLNVRFTATENGSAQIRIINSFGQTLLSKQSTINKGYNNIQVDGLKQLAAGMYIAQLVMNGTVIDNQRVIKN